MAYDVPSIKEAQPFSLYKVHYIIHSDSPTKKLDSGECHKGTSLLGCVRRWGDFIFSLFALLSNI